MISAQLKPTSNPPRARGDHPGIETGLATDQEIAATTPDFIDVSYYQGDINWAQYAASGRTLAVCKLTEGGDLKDPKAASNRAGMRAENIKCGLYHFAYPNTGSVVGDATTEARHFLAQAGTLSSNEFPVLDFETINGLSAAQLTTWASTWCSIVENKTGKRPWLYTSHRIKNQVDVAVLGKYPLWLADYRSSNKEKPPNFAPWPKLMAWQYTDKSGVAGVKGPTDGNYLYGKP